MFDPVFRLLVFSFPTPQQAHTQLAGAAFHHDLSGSVLPAAAGCLIKQAGIPISVPTMHLAAVLLSQTALILRKMVLNSCFPLTPTL